MHVVILFRIAFEVTGERIGRNCEDYFETILGNGTKTLFFCSGNSFKCPPHLIGNSLFTWEPFLLSYFRSLEADRSSRKNKKNFSRKLLNMNKRKVNRWLAG